MQEVTRACLTCKQKPEVCLVPETTGIQNAFKRGPDNATYRKTDEECEVCGGGGALKKQ